MRRAGIAAGKPTQAAKPRARVGVGERVAREVVRHRSGGVCEVCGAARATDWHHRKNRSQGGRWCPANGMDLCRGCHHEITVNPEWAYAQGYMVRSTVDPAAMPALYRGCLAWLLPGGDVEPVDLDSWGAG